MTLPPLRIPAIIVSPVFSFPWVVKAMMVSWNASRSQDAQSVHDIFMILPILDIIIFPIRLLFFVGVSGLYGLRSILFLDTPKDTIYQSMWWFNQCRCAVIDRSITVHIISQVSYRAQHWRQSTSRGSVPDFNACYAQLWFEHACCS